TTATVAPTPPRRDSSCSIADPSPVETGLGPDWDRTRTGLGPDWDRTRTGFATQTADANARTTTLVSRMRFNGHRSFASPPDEMRRYTEQDDADADRGPTGLGRDRVDHKRTGGDDEQQRRPWISGHTERTRRVRVGTSQHEHARGSQPVEDPADENDVCEQLLERAGGCEHHRPRGSEDDAQGRSPESRMHFAEPSEEETVSGHGVVDARRGDRQPVGG